MLGACSAMRTDGYHGDPPGTSATPAGNWRTHYTKAARVSAWNTYGKIGIRHKQKHWNLSFDWEQSEHRYKINMRSLFGHSLHLSGLRNKVYVRRGTQQPVVAKTPEQALNKLLGISAPITLLQHWIRGIPSPGIRVTALETDKHGLARFITQAGWSVRYIAHYDKTEYRFPKHLVIENNDTKLTLWIADWNNIRHSGSSAGLSTGSSIKSSTKSSI